MSLCASSCNAAVPRWSGGGCGNITKRSGGISNLIFLSCNWKFATAAEGAVDVTTPTGDTISVGVITDYTSWAIGVQNNMIRISPDGLGDKPESTFTTARFSSCLPEEIASETHVVNFRSYDIDSVNYYDRTYWNTVRTNIGKYRLIYLNCDNIVHYTGDVSDPGFEFSPSVLGYVIPQTKEEKAYYQANLSFIYEGIPDFVDVVNLSEALNIDANS